MNLVQLLARPYPVIDGVQKKFSASFAFGVFVFLFLYFFKPFGIATFTGRQILLYTLGFGGVTFIIMFINFLILDKLFPSFFREEGWTVGKEIFITLAHIAFIGLGNYFFSTLLSITKATPGKFFYFELISIGMGIFPIVVWTLIRENRLLKQNREEAGKFKLLLHPEKLTTVLETKPEKQDENQPGYDKIITVTFSSESETANIKADPEQVFFISAADNYIKIYLSEGNSIVTKLLRTSLKRTEEDLKNHSQFYRCHRAYIVNLQKVNSVSGNARGLKLALEDCPEEVPVSRSLNDEIRKKLMQIHSPKA